MITVDRAGSIVGFRAACPHSRCLNAHLGLLKYLSMAVCSAAKMAREHPLASVSVTGMVAARFAVTKLSSYSAIEVWCTLLTGIVVVLLCQLAQLNVKKMIREDPANATGSLIVNKTWRWVRIDSRFEVTENSQRYHIGHRYHHKRREYPTGPCTDRDLEIEGEWLAKYIAKYAFHVSPKRWLHTDMWFENEDNQLVALHLKRVFDSQTSEALRFQVSTVESVALIAKLIPSSFIEVDARSRIYEINAVSI